LPASAERLAVDSRRQVERAAQCLDRDGLHSGERYRVHLEAVLGKEDEPIVGCGDAYTAFVYSSMVRRAQQDQVRQIGRSSMRPVHDVMDVQVSGARAAGERAAAVAFE